MIHLSQKQEKKFSIKNKACYVKSFYRNVDGRYGNIILLIERKLVTIVF